MQQFVINVDGATGADAGKRGAGLGVVVRDASGRVRHLLKEWVPGPITCNEAEYAALLLALRALVPLVPCQLTILSDSEVMVNQLIGRFRVGLKGAVTSGSVCDVESVSTGRRQACAAWAESFGGCVGVGSGKWMARRRSQIMSVVYITEQGATVLSGGRLIVTKKGQTVEEIPLMKTASSR